MPRGDFKRRSGEDSGPINAAIAALQAEDIVLQGQITTNTTNIATNTTNIATNTTNIATANTNITALQTFDAELYGQIYAFEQGWIL